MNRLFPFILFLLSMLSASAQPILRSAMSTNSSTAAPALGEIMQWNGAAWAPINTSNMVSASLVNPNVVWVATNGNNTGANGSYNKPFASLSNAVAYARTTLLDNWTIRIRPGRYTMTGRTTALDETNRSPVNIHGATNVAIIGEGYPVLHTTNMCLISAWAVDGLLIQGIRFEGTKNPAIGQLDLFVALRGGTKNVTITDCKFIRIPDHAIGTGNSTLSSSDVTIQGNYFEDVGAISGVVSLTYDGACVIASGSRWVVTGNIMDRVVRGFEPYHPTKSDNMVFSDNIMTRVWKDGVVLIPQNGWISNVVISANVFTAEDVGLPTTFINASSARSVDVYNNLCDGPMSGAISMIDGDPDGFRDWNIQGNVFRNNPNATTTVYSEHAGSRAFTNITFRGNKFINLFGPAMAIRGPGWLIQGNEFIDVAQEGAGSAAIRLFDQSGTTRYNVIANNIFKVNIAADGGVQLGSGATRNVVVGNFFDGFDNHPITDANAFGQNSIPYNWMTNQMFSGTNPLVTMFGMPSGAKVGVGTTTPDSPLQILGINAISNLARLTPVLSNQSYFQIDYTNGKSLFNVGSLPTSVGGYGAIWLGHEGSDLTIEKHNLSSDRNEGVNLNAPSSTGAVNLRQANSTRWFVGSSREFAPGQANVYDIGTPSLPTRSNYFGTALAIGTNWASARLHVAQATAAGQSLRLDDTNYTPRIQMGTYPGAPTLGAIWVGNVTPGAANYFCYSDGSSSGINAPSVTMGFRINNVEQWNYSITGLYPTTDNAEFLGDSTHRIARLDVGTAGITNAGVLKNDGLITAGVGLTAVNGAILGSINHQIGWLGRGLWYSPDANTMRLDGAPILAFNGTSSSQPALKRNGATLETRLADDSAFAATQSLYQRFGSGTPEGAVTAPVGAIYHRTDGGAATSFYVKESGAGNTGWVAK